MEMETAQIGNHEPTAGETATVEASRQELLSPTRFGSKRTGNGTSVAFRNITYQVEVEKKSEGAQLPCWKEKETKVILQDISGIFKSGEVSAIIGASGAGKTSLLNILACRVSKTQGTLLANNTEYNYDKFGDFANYVMQTDVLMQTLTVRETLMFAADLRLNLPEEEKDIAVMNLAKGMKLEKCLDTVIGGPILKGVSGG
jgi:ATP-binding cassette, subfamily G (WHITE), eye pigment precursor transporter